MQIKNLKNLIICHTLIYELMTTATQQCIMKSIAINFIFYLHTLHQGNSIRRDNNKVDSIETGRIVIVDLLP